MQVKNHVSYHKMFITGGVVGMGVGYMQVKNYVSNHKIFMTGGGWGWGGIYEQKHFFLHYKGCL